MNSISNPPQAAMAPVRNAAEPWYRSWWPSLFAVGVFWLMIINQQRLEWSVNPVYSYGWAVPALAGYLFWSRWQDRPAIDSRWSWPVFFGGTALLLFAYLPVRVVQEANPDWVKINFIMASLWAGMVLLVLGRWGGTRSVWHFIFPVLFCYTALPWPVWMQDSLVQNLMRMNASVSAEILTLLGVPAIAKGNLIQVADRWVNVEEACSGIRSLQTAFMMALFLGEFYRITVVRRALLLASSFAVAFLVNLIRTIILTNFAKTDSIEKWHDTVGTIAMVLCLAALWGLAEWFNRGKKSGKHATETEASRVNSSGSEKIIRPPFSWLGAGLVCGWLCLVEVLTLGWYDMHERALPPPLVWNLKLPRQAPGFVEGTFGDRMKALLKFNSGKTASWDTPDGYLWQMYYLQWQPGRVSKYLSSSHYPTVCLPATGLKLVSETGVWNCDIDGVEIPFTTYLFEEDGRDVYVFHAIVEDRPSVGGTRLSYRQVSSDERIESVLRGERNLGQHVVGIAVRGPLAPSEARAAVSSTMESIVSIAAPSRGYKTSALR
jgi:exosortase